MLRGRRHRARHSVRRGFGSGGVLLGSPRRQPRVPSTSECRFNKSPHHQKNAIYRVALGLVPDGAHSVLKCTQRSNPTRFLCVRLGSGGAMAGPNPVSSLNSGGPWGDPPRALYQRDLVKYQAHYDGGVLCQHGRGIGWTSDNPRSGTPGRVFNGSTTSSGPLLLASASSPLKLRDHLDCLDVDECP